MAMYRTSGFLKAAPLGKRMILVPVTFFFFFMYLDPIIKDYCNVVSCLVVALKLNVSLSS